MKKKAVVLLSGGLDSTTVLAIALKQGYEPITLCFDYGQRHRIELEKSRVLSRKMGALEHKEVKIDLRQFGGSALTDDIDVPKGRSEGEMTAEIPITYVPARNTVFLSLALAAAEAAQAQDIFIGVTAIDYSGYPDCRPEYIQAFEQMANLATKAGVEGTSKFKIHTTPTSSRRVTRYRPTVHEVLAFAIVALSPLQRDAVPAHACRWIEGGAR